MCIQSSKKLRGCEWFWQNQCCKLCPQTSHKTRRSQLWPFGMFYSAAAPSHCSNGQDTLSPWQREVGAVPALSSSRFIPASGSSSCFAGIVIAFLCLCPEPSMSWPNETTAKNSPFNSRSQEGEFWKRSHQGSWMDTIFFKNKFSHLLP